MKALVAALALGCASEGAAAEITPQSVLDAIDLICGDTWCEGDFDASFNSLTLSDGKVRLDFELHFPSDAEDELRFPQSCLMDGFPTLADTVVAHGNYLALSDRFYEAVGNCFEKRAARLQRRLDRMVTPALRREACNAIFNGRFSYGYGEQQLNDVCAKARMFVTSLSPSRTEFQFEARSASETNHVCSLRVPRSTGSLEIVECETY